VRGRRVDATCGHAIGTRTLVFWEGGTMSSVDFEETAPTWRSSCFESWIDSAIVTTNG
jgi:hypothetical protein